MEKPHFNFSLVHIKTMLERARENITDPAMLWHAVLYGMFSCAIVVAVFAYLAYTWATNTETATSTQKTSVRTLSLPELREVIAVYQKIEETHYELLRSKPNAPAYERGSGVPVVSLGGSPVTDATSTLVR